MLFIEIVSKDFNLDSSSISVPAYPSETNLKLGNVSITNCLMYRCQYGLKFYNWLMVFLKKAQAVPNFWYEIKILCSFLIFYLLLSFCYLTATYQAMV